MPSKSLSTPQQRQRLAGIGLMVAQTRSMDLVVTASP